MIYDISPGRNSNIHILTASHVLRPKDNKPGSIIYACQLNCRRFAVMDSKYMLREALVQMGTSTNGFVFDTFKNECQKLIYNVEVSKQQPRLY